MSKKPQFTVPMLCFENLPKNKNHRISLRCSWNSFFVLISINPSSIFFRMDNISLISPVGYSSSTCGYCSSPGTRSSKKSSVNFGLWGHSLTPITYELLLDKGWRRSGSYLYKPDNQNTCCPHLTIR